jgi:ribosomal-protein-alanine N-acetyltransferase
MSGTQEIRTRCLLLRRHATEDAAPLYENFGKDPAMFEYTGWNPYATPRMAEERERASSSTRTRNPRFCGWAIDSEGKLVGTIGAYGYDAEKGV